MYDHIRKGLWKLSDPDASMALEDWEPDPDAEILQQVIASTALGPIATDIVTRWLEANGSV